MDHSGRARSSLLFVAFRILYGRNVNGEKENLFVPEFTEPGGSGPTGERMLFPVAFRNLYGRKTTNMPVTRLLSMAVIHENTKAVVAQGLLYLATLRSYLLTSI